MEDKKNIDLEGTQLNEQELENVAGGGTSDVLRCPECGSENVFKGRIVKYEQDIICCSCGHIWKVGVPFYR